MTDTETIRDAVRAARRAAESKDPGEPVKQSDLLAVYDWVDVLLDHVTELNRRTAPPS